MDILIPNRAQLVMRNKYTVFTVALRSPIPTGELRWIECTKTTMLSGFSNNLSFWFISGTTAAHLSFASFPPFHSIPLSNVLLDLDTARKISYIHQRKILEILDIYLNN